MQAKTQLFFALSGIMAAIATAQTINPSQTAVSSPTQSLTPAHPPMRGYTGYQFQQPLTNRFQGNVQPQGGASYNQGSSSPMLPFLFAGGDFSRKMAAMSMMMQPGQQNSALPYFMMSGSDMWPLMAMMGNNGNNRRGTDPLMLMAFGHEML